MMDKNLCLEYLEFLKNYLNVLKEFIEVENKKFEILSLNQLDMLDECVKLEEVYLLKTRGLEQERIKYMQRLGYPDIKFRKLIPLLPEEMQTEYTSVFEEMSEIVKKLKRINLQANSAAKIRLQQIEKAIEKLENTSSKSGYTKEAQKEGKAANFISKKV